MSENNPNVFYQQDRIMGETKEDAKEYLDLIDAEGTGYRDSYFNFTLKIIQQICEISGNHETRDYVDQFEFRGGFTRKDNEIIPSYGRSKKLLEETEDPFELLEEARKL